MATRTVLPRPDLYTIAWIAVGSRDRDAAIALLDEVHYKPHGFRRNPADDSEHAWGRMGKHNIVITSFLSILDGPKTATAVATALLSSLPHIRTGLLVGTGGGIPRPDKGRDIRLGDIVVGDPEQDIGAVVQYDVLKLRPQPKNTHRRGRIDFVPLNRPPPVLVNALRKLREQHKYQKPMVPHFLHEMLGVNPHLAEFEHGHVHQGFENDRLFRASCKHASSRDCRDCDPSQQVRRKMRDSTDPEIHYGVIASGDVLVADAATRGRVVKLVGENCLCVEKEAAGLMHYFPCLVIRGICNYADSHTNDHWKRYASSTAAAFAKELLGYVPT